MSKGGFDLSDAGRMVFSIHILDAALTSGANQLTSAINTRTGSGLAMVSYNIEPQLRSKVNPPLGPDLDSLTRLVIQTSYQGTMDAAELHFSITWSRTGSGALHTSPELRVGLATNTTLHHVIELPFPADFGQAAGNNISDFMQARMTVIPTANSTGNVIVVASVSLIPGLTSGAQTPPRGAFYSKAGIDY